ncbi:SLAP domain-containing protein [Companilactobacillus kedongensis]|uniref:SLAP domain-containing protein n=1 Tax=Companilactobacillus kedongensis TaxID=2486004 RepID=UPI000F7B2C4F|nr:SLAP domain-containing protein [Companilactobacillus kedongensis]
MDFRKKRLSRVLEDKTYKFKLVHGKKGWLTGGLTFITLLSVTALTQTSVDASAVNNVATANSTTGTSVPLWNSVTEDSIHKSSRSLQNGTDWKTAKAVKGVDGETYLLVGGNEYANAKEMDLKDETSKQDLTGVVRVDNIQYARLYTNPLEGAELISNRSLQGTTDWKTDTKVTVDGVTYYRVSTNEWVKANNVSLISESSRSEKTYIKNNPDAEDTNTTDTNNNGGSTTTTNPDGDKDPNEGGSTTTPTDSDGMLTYTVNYFDSSKFGSAPITLKTETGHAKLGDVVTIKAPEIAGYTVVPGENNDNLIYTIQEDGETFNIPYTEN